MKLRKLRKARQERTNQNKSHCFKGWDDGSTQMYFIRDVKPCKTYSQWCVDCNAVLFRKIMGRFPYSIVEFNEFKDKQRGENE